MAIQVWYAAPLPPFTVQVAPKIMTWQQYGEAAYSMARKRLAGGEGPDYVPDFTRCVDHFAIHAGKRGRPWI